MNGNWKSIRDIMGGLDLVRSVAPNPAAEAGACESHLEAVFLACWEERRAGSQNSHNRRLRLIPQQEIKVSSGKVYRVDFVLEAPVAAVVKLAIELDGRDFHERTKEQVINRDRRDRALQRDGWMVFHFSGPEIFADCGSCVDEVLDYGKAVAAIER